jgi:hypothetical protein
MTLPAALLGLIVSSLYGVLFHLVRDGRLGRLLMYMALSWFGFALGHLIGFWRDWILLAVGPLNLGMGTLGSLIVLGLGDWASRIQARPQSKV